MKRTEIIRWLNETRPDHLAELWHRADEARRLGVGDEVHLRGLIEFSNHCERDCAYCGLRATNLNFRRYRMSRTDIVRCVGEAHRRGFGTVVLQSGDDYGMPAVELAAAIRGIRTHYDVAVTISAGERPVEDYRLWRESGADRYLLKFETSDRELYRRIHPPHRTAGADRLCLLGELRKLGYEIGSGIMVGMPGQTMESLADDIRLFATLDLDMIAIGPYVPHPGTPLGRQYERRRRSGTVEITDAVGMTLKVIALARIICPEANIPATTALATALPDGFAEGLRVGANVIMPNLTPVPYRSAYLIYPNPFVRPDYDGYSLVLDAIEKASRTPGQGSGARTPRLAALVSAVTGRRAREIDEDADEAERTRPSDCRTEPTR